MSLRLSPERLVAARKGAGLSQQQAAAHIGIALSTLQVYEYGRHEPRASLAAKLADLYHVELLSLFETHDCDRSAGETSLRHPNGGLDSAETPAPGET